METPMSTTTDKQVAQTILQQLGGQRRLKTFVGAKDFLLLEGGGVTFKFKGSRKVNYVRIRLNGMDLYDLEFVKAHGVNIKVVEEETNVYADQLVTFFEKHTGLYLSL